MKLNPPYLIKPHTKVKLSHHATAGHTGYRDKDAADLAVKKHRDQLADLQDVLYAAQSKAILIVLQGMDTAGKDGTIRHIFSGINPQGCNVSSFKVPTPEEARHDFLWRCQKQTPARGMIGIFNRSHYEDVLSPFVHGLIDKRTVKRRLADINAWEQTLANEDVVILKFFLHISREEQTERLQSRIDTPDKHWKLSPPDFAERQYWPQYTAAYEHLLSHTSQSCAPWYVIPADHKWFRNVAISTILVETLKSLNLKYPKPAFDPSGLNLKKQDAAAAEKKVAKAVKKAAS